METLTAPDGSNVKILHEFEFAGLRFKFCQRYVPGAYVVDMGVLHTCEVGEKLLDNENYYYNCFVVGRLIWIRNKELSCTI